MKRLLSILTCLFAAFGCSQPDTGTAVLSHALHGYTLVSARDLQHRQNGLRERVDELFFRANPSELKSVLSKAGFVRDDSIPKIIRGSNTNFKVLAGANDQPGAIGYKRTDLAIESGRYCYTLCAEDFSWAYIIYVDAGRS